MSTCLNRGGCRSSAGVHSLGVSYQYSPGNGNEEAAVRRQPADGEGGEEGRVSKMESVQR